MRATSRVIGAIVVPAIFVVTLLLAADATAQVRVPDAGMSAVGGDVGLFFPGDDFESAPTLVGFYEYYFTPRLSIRPSLGFTDPDFDFDNRRSLRQRRLLFSVLYNWEYGKWHPFVGGGLGVYFLQDRFDGDDVGDGHNKLGLHGAGGIEYFIRRTLALKGEAQVHFIGDDDDLPGSPSGVALLFGVKKYF